MVDDATARLLGAPDDFRPTEAEFAASGWADEGFTLADVRGFIMTAADKTVVIGWDEAGEVDRVSVRRRG